MKNIPVWVNLALLTNKSEFSSLSHVMSNVNWEGMHKDGNRPWDLNGVTPILKHFFEIDEKGRNLGTAKRILIPGCGQVIQIQLISLIIAQWSRKMIPNFWGKFLRALK